jgi:hypothetical protein
VDKIRALAMVSVGRGCGFAGLATVTLMVGLSYDPVLMTQVGAISLSIAAAILRLFALAAPHRNPRRTEVWTMLDPVDAPPPEIARQVINRALAETYNLFFRWTLAIGLALWVLSVGLRLLSGS